MFLCFNNKKMLDPNKLDIQTWEAGWVVLKPFASGHAKKYQIFLGKEEIIEILNKLPPEEKKEILASFPDKKEEERSGVECSDLVPEGREFAPQSAKKYRKELEKRGIMVQHMKYLKSIVSYNTDGTMNILPLKKTFCNDLTWKWERMNHWDALKLAESTWYQLLSDYNSDFDTETERQQTDFYKVMSLFNRYGKNGWDSVEAREIFWHMSWCDGKRWWEFEDDRFWTATPYKDELSKIDIGRTRILVRMLNMMSIVRNKSDVNFLIPLFVCWRKDMAN